MEKSSELIRKKEFHIVFKGYKPEEVDKFLDLLSVEFDKLIRKNRELQESLDKLKFAGTTENDGDIRTIIESALVSAHKVAEEIKSQARIEAEEIITSRKTEEENALQALAERKASLEESILLLQDKYEDYKNNLRKHLDDFTRLLDEEEVAPAIEQEEILYQESSEEVPSDNEEPITDNDDIIGKSDLDSGAIIEKEPVENEIFHEENDSDDAIKQKRISSGFNELDNYSTRKENPGGFYPDKKQDPGDVLENQDAEGDSNTDTEADAADMKQDLSDNSLKRERKKIDIANPDIIENFFKTSDD